MIERSGGQEEIAGAPCVWVLASSPTWDTVQAVGWLPRPDKVVAADGGLALAKRLGLRPDLVIGDMDSAARSLVEASRASGVETRRYEHATKPETDTELAALAALDWNPGRIYLLGATGGRLDHMLANILLLTHPRLAPVDVRLIEGRQEVFLAKPGRWNAIAGDVGDFVTLLPVGGEAVGIKTEGLLYPLASESLLVGRGRGVSNVIVGPQARVWFENGYLLVVAVHLLPVKEEKE